MRTRVTATLAAVLTALALAAGPAVADTPEEECEDPLYLYLLEDDDTFTKTYVRCLDDDSGTPYDPVLR